VAKLTALPSIQGEALNARRDHYYADQGYVDKYARECSEGVATCRERFAHRYPRIPKNKPFDTKPSVGGFLVRETDPCLDCGCAIQVQRYYAYYVGKGRNRELRVRPAHNTVRYIENEYGETYTTKDHGFVRPKDFRDSIVTAIVQASPDLQAQASAAAGLREDVLRKREERQAAMA
jgi:hypothetical protein